MLKKKKRKKKKKEKKKTRRMEGTRLDMTDNGFRFLVTSLTWAHQHLIRSPG